MEKFQSWAFRRLKKYVEYKAEEKGIKVRTVDSKYTSQRCSKCGYVSKRNRKGRKFRCEKCGYKVDADHNASKNIGMKAITILGGQKFHRGRAAASSP